MDKLYFAFIVFGTIDLLLVGTTCVFVVMLVRKILKKEIAIDIRKVG